MKKTKIGIIVACVAIGFYVIGAMIGWPGKSPLLAGDAANASKSKIKVVNIDQDAIQEKLKSDTTYCNEMLAAVGMMQINAQQFETLLDVTIKNCGSVAKLKTCIEQMKDFQETAHNANLAINQVATDMELLTKGEKVLSFEQDLNNASLSFSILDRASTLADMFVDEVNKLDEKNETLETLQAEWLSFAFSNSLLNCNQYHFNHLEELATAFMNQQQLQGGRNTEVLKGIRNSEQLGANLDLLSATFELLGNTHLKELCSSEKLIMLRAGDALSQSVIGYFVVYDKQNLNQRSFAQEMLKDGGLCQWRAVQCLANAGFRNTESTSTSLFKTILGGSNVLNIYLSSANQLGITWMHSKSLGMNI